MPLLRAKVTNAPDNEVRWLKPETTPDRITVGGFKLPDIDTVWNSNNARSQAERRLSYPLQRPRRDNER
jgi:hypothetical protein